VLQKGRHWPFRLVPLTKLPVTGIRRARCSLAVLVQKYLLSGTKVQILTAEELLLDLSPFYLAESKKLLNKYAGVTYVEAAAEAVPSVEEHYDAITCVYLFHELPEVVRTRVVQEWFRVLKPGGKVFFVDMH
jgi:ubiquinone/menaquinone biosynthesis C-methylase UbiE